MYHDLSVPSTNEALLSKEKINMAKAKASTSNNDEIQLNLKKSLHFTIGKMCEEVEQQKGITFDQLFIAALTETTYKQAVLYAWDLEAFAKHAKRTIINVEDVKLLARRNKLLTSHIEKLIEENEQNKKEASKTSRKKKQKMDPMIAATEQNAVEDSDTRDSDICPL